MPTTWTGTSDAIECEGCANSIQRVLGKTQGVERVSVDVAAKRVTVQYDADCVSDAEIKKRLDAAGFPVAE